MIFDRKSAYLFTLGISVISLCGIIYELLISVVASYVLGDSIFYFSITIGLFLFFMGVGAYISRFFLTKDTIKVFISIELLIGFVGGCSVLILFYLFGHTQYFFMGYLLTVAIIGICMGIEIPLATSLLNSEDTSSKSMVQTKTKTKTMTKHLSNVLTLDYIGALAGSILFPLILLPYLGLSVTAIFVGLLNTTVALMLTYIFVSMGKLDKAWYLGSLCVSVVLVAMLWFAKPLQQMIDAGLYRGKVILSQNTPYQNITVTNSGDNVTNLYLNGKLQFSSLDEHRYHEAIVHVPMSFISTPRDILVLGGGDGMAVREVLKYEEIESVTVVDLDKMVSETVQKVPLLSDLQDDSLKNQKVALVHQDAFTYVQTEKKMYDLIIVDLPDPYNHSVGKLYTQDFYVKAREILKPNGLIVTQASSPYLARKAFWSIVHAQESVFSATLPYNIYLPTLGQWGFVLSGNSSLKSAQEDHKINTKYYSQTLLPSMVVFDSDNNRITTGLNTLENQITVQYYTDSFKKWK